MAWTESKIRFDTKLSEVSPDIPAAAKDITVGEIVAMRMGKLSSRTLELTVKDLKTIRAAIGEAYTGEKVAESVGSCCCCCVDRPSDKKLGEISPNIPATAKDITVGDMVAMSKGKISSQTLELTVKDLKTVYNALDEWQKGGMEANSVVSCSCCCCYSVI